MEEKQLSIIKPMKEKEKMIIYFFIYAFLGWILETIYCIATLHTFNNRGFLYGPICPMYGIGAVILIISLKSFEGNKVKKFFVGMIIFTIFEYIVSYLLETIFGLRWWDYTDDLLNLQGRVSLIFSIAWGVMAVVFVEKIHPFISKQLEKLFNKTSRKIQIIVFSMLGIGILVDLILSVMKYVNM